MKYVVSATGIIILVSVLALAYYGLFARVVIEEREMGGFVLVYENHKGPYQEVGGIIEKIYSSLLGEYNVTGSKGFGLYYDDPQAVRKEDLRSIAGCILDGEDAGSSAYIGGRYKTAKYPRSKCVTAEFPFRGTFSIFLGILKVYPKLKEHMDKNGYPPVPIMEIYDSSNRKIIYVASVTLEGEVYNDFLK